MSDDGSIKKLPLNNFKRLNNIKLLEYRKRLQAHGELVEAYVKDLQAEWIALAKELDARVRDLEEELSYAQLARENSDDPEFYYELEIH